MTAITSAQGIPPSALTFARETWKKYADDINQHLPESMHVQPFNVQPIEVQCELIEKAAEHLSRESSNT